jgi:hypothetical protein
VVRPRDSVFVPPLLSALVWPGAGQIRNRDYVKGVSLIALTLFLIVALAIQLALSLVASVADPSRIDISAWVAQALKTRAALSAGAMLLVVWLYAVVDAFLIARARRSGALEERGEHPRPRVRP